MLPIRVLTVVLCSKTIETEMLKWNESSTSIMPIDYNSISGADTFTIRHPVKVRRNISDEQNNTIANRTEFSGINVLNNNIALFHNNTNDDYSTTKQSSPRQKQLTKPDGSPLQTIVLYVTLIIIVAILSGIIHAAFFRNRGPPRTNNKRCNTRETKKITYTQVCREEPRDSAINRSWQGTNFSKASTCAASQNETVQVEPIVSDAVSISSTEETGSSTKTRPRTTSICTSQEDACSQEVSQQSPEPGEEEQNEVDEALQLCSKCNGCRNAKAIVKKINEIEIKSNRIHIPISIPVTLDKKTIRSCEKGSSSLSKPNRSCTSTHRSNISSTKFSDEKHTSSRVSSQPNPNGYYSANSKKSNEDHTVCFEEDEHSISNQSIPSEAGSSRSTKSTSAASYDGSSCSCKIVLAQLKKTRSERSIGEGSYHKADSVISSEQCATTSNTRFESEASSNPSTMTSNAHHDSVASSAEYTTISNAHQSPTSTNRTFQDDARSVTQLSPDISRQSSCDQSAKFKTIDLSASTDGNISKESQFQSQPSTVESNAQPSLDQCADSEKLSNKHSQSASTISEDNKSVSSRSMKTNHLEDEYEALLPSKPPRLINFKPNNTSSQCASSFQAPVKFKVLSTDPNYSPNTLDVKTQLNQLLSERRDEPKTNQSIKPGNVIYADVCFVKPLPQRANPQSEKDNDDYITKNYKNTPSEYHNGDYQACQDTNYDTYQEPSNSRNYGYQECNASVCSDDTRTKFLEKFGPGYKKASVKYCGNVERRAGLIYSLNQRLKGKYLSRRQSALSEFPDDFESNYETECDPEQFTQSRRAKFLPKIRQYMQKHRKSSTCSEYSETNTTQLCEDCLRKLPSSISDTIRTRASLNSKKLKGRGTLHLDDIVQMYPKLCPQLPPLIKEALTKSSDNLSVSQYSNFDGLYERGRESKCSELSSSFENIRCLH